MWQFVEIQPESFRDGHSLYSVPPFAVRSAGKIKRAASRQVWRKQIMRFSGNGPFLTATEKDHLCSTTLLEDKSRKTCFFFISNHLKESKFKITREFKSFCPDGLMGGTVHPAADLHAVRSCKHTHSHEQTCMPTPAAAYKTHTQQECYIFISGVSTGSVPSWAQDCSAGRTNLSMSLLRVKNCPIPCERSALIAFFYSREYICDGSWHHVAILNIFLCCKSAQRRCEGASDAQGTRQIRRYTTSTNSWHVDIYNKVHYEMCQVSSETGQAHKRPTNSYLQKRPGQKHRQSRLEQWGGQKDVG